MIEWASGLVASGGLAGVFLLMVAENLFPPMPSEVIMPLAGFAAARGQMPLLGVILAGVAGSLVGNAFWYELARAYGAVRMRRVLDRFGRYVGLTPDIVLKAEAALRRNGPAAVCLARMMPGIRTGISIPAGLVALPRPVFYIWTALGTGLWTGGLATAGWALEDQFHLVEDWAGPIGLIFMAGVVGTIGWHIWKARRAG
ncbi:DedA family protein [Paeniroseomonas aquatica]|uniref:DedA family protein n=2 Tax=Paeniroseomonas aquatica TaxID=373043 RepID=A0ABT8A165_9PROT|nr:DedA family protein [Paeniroseomonas aquatica]MDN3563465.1 DedA family protein [Paeniroseomonas aquatica]